MTRAASLRRLSPFLALALLLGALALFHAAPAGASHTLVTPTNLQAQAGNGQVTLTWATGGGNHANYDVAHGEHPSGSLSTQVAFSTANRTVTITGLTNGTTYRFRVKARSFSGHNGSAWTDFVTATPTAPVTVWSATLTADQNGGFFGCDNLDSDQDNCSSATVLTEDEFTHGGTTYTVIGVYWQSSTDRLFFAVDFTDAAATKTALNSWTLHVDGTALPISTAATGTTGERPLRWSYDPATDWTDGRTVSLSLTRTAASDADLSGLTSSTSGSASGTFSALTLSPSPFAAATTAYTASVANTVTHVKITPTTNDSNATVEVGKQGQTLTAVTSGSASAAIALAVGANAITVKVTAEDGSTTVTYTVTVTRAQAQQSSDADLSGLTASTSASASGTFSALTLSPSTFAAATTAYTASVANTVTHVKITPTVAESNATVEVGKGSSLATVTSGSASTAISLQVGANAITVKVTAQDGSTTKTYTVTVTRAQAQQSSDADLSGLTATSSTSDSTAFTALNIGAFASGTTTYAATVPNTVDEVKLRPTVAESNASVEVGLQGQTLTAVTSGTESGAISLSVGANAITVKVTAQDGTVKTYTVTVTREAPPAQTNSVWQATLTVDQAGVFFGCDNDDANQDDCSSSTVLTEDEFTHGGTTYTVNAVYWRGDVDRLYLSINNEAGQTIKTALRSLTLHVDGTALAVSDATAGGVRILWSYDPATDWTDGRTVSLSLQQTPRPQVFPDLDRLPVKPELEDRGTHAPYCYIGEGNGMTEYIRYPNGRIEETSRQSDAIRSMFACD